MFRVVKLSLSAILAGLLLLAPAAVHASTPEGHGGQAKKGDKKEAGKPVDGRIDVGPIVVNVLSNKGYRFLRLAMDVQCEDNSAAERILGPDAKEAVMLLLSTRMAEDLLPPTGKMILRKDLVECLGQFTGAGKVKNIYFTDFVLQ